MQNPLPSWKQSGHGADSIPGVEDGLLQKFKRLITTRLGLQIRDPDSLKLNRIFWLRTELLNLSNPEAYYGYLESETSQGKLEWKRLAIHLTTGESHFFRDKGQFALLKSWILPRLIKAGERRNTLRIWSAGCSTGEEAYSLAILLNELIPNPQGWNLFILGTDLNGEAIEKAKRGVYGSWSFRAVDSDLRRRYFQSRNNEWELDEGIRSMVTFREGNLLGDRYPDDGSGLWDMDLILCRNVFIYFERGSVSIVAKKFADTLRDSGYLLTGHTELSGIVPERLRPKLFPDSMIYQRVKNGQDGMNERIPEPPEGPSVNGLAEGLPSPSSEYCPDPGKAFQFGENRLECERPEPPASLEEAETRFEHGAYREAIVKAKEIIDEGSGPVKAHYIVAHSYANLGENEKATGYCKQAIKIDPMMVEPYYLLAHLAEEKGDSEETKKLLKKVIYLSPSFISAYLMLGSVYEREEDPGRARKMRRTALDLLRKMPTDAVVEPYQEMTVGELVLYIEKRMGEEKDVPNPKGGPDPDAR